MKKVNRFAINFASFAGLRDIALEMLRISANSCMYAEISYMIKPLSTFRRGIFHIPFIFPIIQLVRYVLTNYRFAVDSSPNQRLSFLQKKNN